MRKTRKLYNVYESYLSLYNQLLGMVYKYELHNIIKNIMKNIIYIKYIKRERY